MTHDDARLRAEVEGLLAHALSPGEPQVRVRDCSTERSEPLYAPGARVGAYCLSTCLASSGSSEVYLAERADGLFDKRVAVKILVTADAVADAAFRRECQLLARLDHPGIVGLLDAGLTSANHPYIVLNHVPGLPLTAWATQEAPSLETRITLLHALASALAFAHQRGIVHCDIKPANVLVTSPKTLKLLDFGIARGEAAEDIAALSADYAAPERLQGEPSTPASDAFSFGVTAFEFLTGRLPWPPSGDHSPAHHAQQRHARQPPLLSEAAAAAPDPPVRPDALRGGLERIVSRCLAASPDDRYPDAAAIAEDLQRWQSGAPLLGGMPTGPVPNRRWDPAPCRPVKSAKVPRRHRFIGRRAELGLLEDLWADAREGRGGAVLVSGPPGIGKTRLVEHFIGQSTEDGVVLRGAFLAAQTHRPFAPIANLLEANLESTQGRAPDDYTHLEGMLRAAGCHQTEDAGLLARVLGWPPDPSWPLPAHSAEYGRRRVYEILTRWLFLTCAERPLLLILEDLHWADHATPEWLGLLQPSLATQPVLLIATGRSEVRMPWATAANSLSLNLRALRGDAARDLIAELTGKTEINPAFAARLHERSGGNPLFLEELVTRLQARGDAFQQALEDGGAASDLDDVPESIVALTEERLNMLGPARMMAEAIAVFDGALSWEQLLALLGQPASGVDAALSALIHDGLIRAEGIDSARRLSFSHALLRDATYAGIGTDSRRDLHARVATLLAHESPQELARIAYHYEQADEPTLAREYWTRAADQAAANYANADAISAANRALELCNDPQSKIPLQLALGRVLGRVGRHADAVDTLQQALAAIPDTRPTWAGRAWRLIGDVRQAAFEHGESASAYFEASQRLDRPSANAPDADWDDYLHVRIQQAGLLFYLGEAPDMEELLDSIADDVAKHGQPMQRLNLRRERGRAALIRQRARVSDAILSMEYETLAMAQRECGAEGEALAQFSVGFAHLWRDELEAAGEHLEASADRLQHTGQFQLGVICDVYLACLWRQRDDQTRALDFAERVEQRAENIRMPVYLGVAAAIRAWAACRSGDLTLAERHACRTFDYLSDTARIPFPFRWLAALPLLATRHAQGRGMEMVAELGKLLEPPQHQLPEPLHAAVSAAVAEPDPARLDAVIAAARHVRYMP